MNMEIRPLSQGNALLVEGLSLWEPLSTEVVDALREAWSRTGLLV
ncbi:MAG: hypothetical protein ACI8PT_004649, partial [Gammaproteobacteria bacterium]